MLKKLISEPVFCLKTLGFMETHTDSGIVLVSIYIGSSVVNTGNSSIWLSTFVCLWRQTLSNCVSLIWSHVEGNNIETILLYQLY